jgi:hypothetical protein
MNIFYQILSLIFSGVVGGAIAFYYSSKLTKLEHRMVLREDKYDEFIKSINLLKDMIDVVTMEASTQLGIYMANEKAIESKYLDLFNKILEQGSKCVTLTQNYGFIYDAKDIAFDEIMEVHNSALNVTMQINHKAKNLNNFKIDLTLVIDDEKVMKEKWKELKNKLNEIIDSAAKKRKNDLI